MQPIIFYDIPGATGPWSPNTWTTRYILNIKGLPFTTVWVEMPDIEATVSTIGAPPTSTKPDGSDYYTLPIICDPNTGKVVSESIQIAKYLDQKYPSIKVLSGDGSGEEEAAFKAQQLKGMTLALAPFVVMSTYHALSERSQAYYRPMREARFGKKLEDMAPLEKRPALLEAIHQGLSADYLTERCHQVAKGITYKDIIIASGLTWVKAVLPADEYGTIVGWDEGRWEKFMEHFERFQKAS